MYIAPRTIKPVVLLLVLLAISPALTRADNPPGEQRVYIESENFVIFHGENEQWCDNVLRLLEHARTQFQLHMEKSGFTFEAPQKPLVWVCFADRREFEQHARFTDQMNASWLDAYYSARSNVVSIVRDPTARASRDGAVEMTKTHATADIDTSPRIDASKLTHEAAHQLSFNTGVQKRGVMYPLWVSEGIATCFEADPSGVIDPACDNPQRSGRLRRLSRLDRLVPLEDFITLVRIPAESTEKSLRIYAQAWGFFNFAFTRHPESLRRYLLELSRLKPGQRNHDTMLNEFITAFGPIEDIELEWHDYLVELDK